LARYASGCLSGKSARSFAVAKSDFICRPCNEVKASGYLRGRKYECPTHGTLCAKHIEAHVLGRDRCKDCESQVITYSWNFSQEEWIAL
jgi:hypothetical protein